MEHPLTHHSWREMIFWIFIIQWSEPISSQVDPSIGQVGLASGIKHTRYRNYVEVPGAHSLKPIWVYLSNRKRIFEVHTSWTIRWSEVELEKSLVKYLLKCGGIFGTIFESFSIYFGSSLKDTEFWCERGQTCFKRGLFQLCWGRKVYFRGQVLLKLRNVLRGRIMSC